MPSRPANSDIEYPIRLTVRFRSPEALIAEYTRSIGRGGVALTSTRPLTLGKTLILQMVAPPEVEQPVDVTAKIVHCQPVGEGQYSVGIKYQADGDEVRKALDEVLQRIFDRHKWEKKRRYPRVPVSLRVSFVASGDQGVIRDLSLGGARVTVLGRADLPEGIRQGSPLKLIFPGKGGGAEVFGEVVWIIEPPGGMLVVPPVLGIKFGAPSRDGLKALKVAIRLEELCAGQPPILIETL